MVFMIPTSTENTEYEALLLPHDWQGLTRIGDVEYPGQTSFDMQDLEQLTHTIMEPMLDEQEYTRHKSSPQ